MTLEEDITALEKRTEDLKKRIDAVKKKEEETENLKNDLAKKEGSSVQTALF